MITTRQPTITRRTDAHCPVCGGLECLCRPRFFAGQLLTEEDLNRLEHYIIGKNKLHNRYLHGSGVVCGLEVLCNPCQGWVTVKSGYALSPCGDDIVVCEDTAVNVCDLIKQCQDQLQRQWDCDPAWPSPNPVCGNQDEPWVLYVCYDEKPSRGITPLRGASGAPCCSRCSCGGSSACGCGCHEKTNGGAKGSCRSPQPKTPPQCEPTVTCEGYTFQVRKLRSIDKQGNLGELVNRVSACLGDLSRLQDALNKLPGSQHLESDAARIVAGLIDLMDEHGIADCSLYQRVREPLPRDAATGNLSIAEVQKRLHAIILELLQECLCSALLPSCPPPAEDNCVPIATLTVNCKSGCQIIRVCNWEHRRMVMTFPTLEYWFGALLNQAGVAQALTKLCCTPVRIPSTATLTAVPAGVSQPNIAAGGGPPAARENLVESRESTDVSGAAPVDQAVADDLVRNLLDEAVRSGGTVKRASVYGQLASIVRDLLSNLTK